MYSVTEEEIVRLAQLTRVRISKDEKKTLKENLQKVVQYIDQLAEVDTENVPPCVHVNDHIENVFRADEEKTDLTRDTFLQNAPDQVSGMIKTPSVIKFE